MEDRAKGKGNINSEFAKELEGLCTSEETVSEEEFLDKNGNPKAKPYMEIDSGKGERMYKNAFLVEKGRPDNFNKRWGMKILSKERADGSIYFCHYFGYVDLNDDWQEKHGGGIVNNATKEQLDNFLNMLPLMAKGLKNSSSKKDLDFEVQVQDYTMFKTFEAQLKYGAMNKQVECKKVIPTKKGEKNGK